MTMLYNEGQQKAIDLALAGENVFITGSGGVGKSVVIRAIVEKLRRSAVLLAPTGIAALNVGGSTIHRVFRMPFHIASEADYYDIHGDTLFDDDIVETLIIDEISMVRADYFITMDYKLRKIKGVNLPFGGLQVILVGDFFQLPPVLNDSEAPAFFQIYKSMYCFNTASWKELDLNIIELEQVMRQDDESTIRAFNCIRRAKSLQPVLKWINRVTEDVEIDLDAIRLCTTNRNADATNSVFYEEIDAREHVFTARIIGKFKERPVPEILKLKVGCKVVLCANDGDLYKNGDTGVIVKFDYDKIVVQLDRNGDHVHVSKHAWESYSYSVNSGKLNKSVEGSFKQYPIKIGYAITIHKSQGMTLDECVLDLGSGSFAHGQTYVGLSRIRSLDKLELERDILESDIIVDSEVIEFYNEVISERKL